jgi:hypothetical protein
LWRRSAQAAVAAVAAAAATMFRRSQIEDSFTGTHTWDGSMAGQRRGCCYRNFACCCCGPQERRCGLCRRYGKSKFQQHFMEVAMIKFEGNALVLSALRNNYVRFVAMVETKSIKMTQKVKRAQTIVVIIGILMMVMVGVSDSSSIENLKFGKEILIWLTRIITLCYTFMTISINKLQMVEKAMLHSLTFTYLRSLGTYIIQGTGMYQNFATPRDALPVFWANIEALRQAFNVESLAILQGKGSGESMQRRLLDAIVNSMPKNEDGGNDGASVFNLPHKQPSLFHQRSSMPESEAATAGGVFSRQRTLPNAKDGAGISAELGGGAGKGATLDSSDAKAGGLPGAHARTLSVATSAPANAMRYMQTPHRVGSDLMTHISEMNSNNGDDGSVNASDWGEHRRSHTSKRGGAGVGRAAHQTLADVLSVNSGSSSTARRRKAAAALESISTLKMQPTPRAVPSVPSAIIMGGVRKLRDGVMNAVGAHTWGSSDAGSHISAATYHSSPDPAASTASAHSGASAPVHHNVEIHAPPPYPTSQQVSEAPATPPDGAAAPDDGVPPEGVAAPDDDAAAPNDGTANIAIVGAEPEPAAEAEEKGDA